MVAKIRDTRPRPPTLAEIRAAAARLAPYVFRTPLLRLEVPGTAGEIYLKLENLQPIGAYKVRSIGNVMLQADRNSFGGGAYTASSGNAGLALAWAAQQLGIAARVYAPEGSPAGKLAAIRRFGAEVCLLEHDSWWRIIQDRGHPPDPGVYVDAVRDNRALAGNATIGLEIVEQLPEVATVLVPFGGGGVACGIAAAMRALKPGVRVIAAESAAATPLTAAFQAGKPVVVPVTPSFISGAGAPSVLEEMWPLVRDLIDATAVVSVAAVAAAIRALCQYAHVVAEGAGAIPVAAALAAAPTADPTADPAPDPTANPTAGPTVCVITGGNLDLDVLAAILQHQL